jgi:radical SAM protein with 4Fe4S-binding SPASM domain
MPQSETLLQIQSPRRTGSQFGPPQLMDVDMSPLQTTRVVGGHAVAPVGDDYVFSNDVLLEGLQPYPGHRLPEAPERTRFPVPDRVGEYCDRATFKRLPKFMAQWVHWPERTEMILAGRYHELPPVHFEGIFTLVCNFMCPHCSRRVTRSDWVDGGTWSHSTEVEKRNTMHPEGLKRVIDEMATMRTDHQMGIVWGGGDPTASPFTYDAMLYARSKGILASFLTNGVYLEADRALDAEPILIRISLNCGTEEAYRKFHGYPKGMDAFDRVKRVMRELARRKLERKARTLIGISLIMDERNLDDMEAAANEIAAVVDDAGGGIDYVIVRPVMNYAHFTSQWAKLEIDTKKRAFEMVEEGGKLHELISEKLGIPLVPIKDSFEPPPPESFYKDSRCLAYGMAGEIRHNGDVQLCSDSYGNPDYTVGNLFEQSIRDIWTSERRLNVLEKINEKECFKTTCPHNSRGHHYNRVFHQIEEWRRRDQMDVVRQWIEDLRETTYPLGHSFFL